MDWDSTEFSEALAQGIARAKELDQEQRKSRDRLSAACGALGIASKLYGNRALVDYDERAAAPKAPDFDKLQAYLLKCNDTLKVTEGVERELAWCERSLAGAGPDFAEANAVAAEVAGEYRERMADLARGFLAEGETLDEGVPAVYQASFEPWSAPDEALLAELLAEVKAAFEVYRRVIADNGPFALYPTVTLELPKLSECVGEVRGANAKPYFGILDDDFMDHVDAFWLGFCKLGTLCENRATPDLTVLFGYFDTCERELGDALEGHELVDIEIFEVIRNLRHTLDEDAAKDE